MTTFIYDIKKCTGFKKKIKDITEEEILDYISDYVGISVDRIKQVKKAVTEVCPTMIYFYHPPSNVELSDQDLMDRDTIEAMVGKLYDLYAHSNYKYKILDTFIEYGSFYSCDCLVCKGTETNEKGR